ncbi:MAG: metallophosphoesterase [Kiritimatiellae bacterium]|nr:metallophosphoesterase [Kiritimatiellia bacterium]
MNRRDFMIGGGAVALCRPILATAAETLGLRSLNVVRRNVKVGAARPFRVMHISDTHLAFCDTRDGDRKRNLAIRQHATMRHGEHYLDEAIAFAKAQDAVLMHTGDLIDFTSEANFDAAREHLAGRGFFVCSGNHEFSQYLGEAKEDAAYKAQSYDRVQACFPNDLTFANMVVQGVNFVAVDNVYYNFTEGQLARFEKEVAKGLPIVLLCHTPLYTPALFERQLKATGGHAAYLCGAPKSALARCDKKRAEQQAADKPTLEFVERVRSEPLVKAVLCGHVHRPELDRFSPTAMTYVAGANYMGDAELLAFL